MLIVILLSFLNSRMTFISTSPSFFVCSHLPMILSFLPEHDDRDRATHAITNTPSFFMMFSFGWFLDRDEHRQRLCRAPCREEHYRNCARTTSKFATKLSDGRNPPSDRSYCEKLTEPSCRRASGSRRLGRIRCPDATSFPPEPRPAMSTAVKPGAP